MQKHWRFTQNNVFSELMMMIARISHDNLACQIEYLKVENQILRNRIGRSVRPTASERRKLLIFGLRIGKDIRNIISIVKYETFQNWVRNNKRRKGTYSIKVRGRPKTLEEIRLLVVKMADENAWGYVRILGELKKLGINRLSKSSVKNILKEHNIDPCGNRSDNDTWNAYINRHFQTLWACDFFTKQVLTPLGPRVFFILFFINIRTRKVHIAGATRYPDQEWVCKQTKCLISAMDKSNNVNKLLIRDRDSKFTKEFDDLFNNAGFTVHKTPFMSPNMNAYAESWVGTIKRECLNYFTVFGERHLTYLISEYAKHYNTTRPHSSMENMPLEPTICKSIGEIKCQSKRSFFASLTSSRLHNYF